MTRYLSAEKMSKDDFGDQFTMKEGELVYDAATFHGPWATMTERSWKLYGCGVLGTGRGQKYKRNDAGELWKVEG